MSFSLPGKKIYYISGTASIDKYGHVLYLGDLEKQTNRLLENIEALLKELIVSLSRHTFAR